MTTGEPRNRIDEALLLSQSLYCSDMTIGLMTAGCLDPYDAPINPMLVDFLNKYTSVAVATINDSASRHRPNPPFGPLISMAALCLAAKKCNEAKATLSLTNNVEVETEISVSVVKYLCELDPFIAALAVVPIDTMLRNRAITPRMLAIMHRLIHISCWVVNANPNLFQNDDRVDVQKISAKFLTVMNTNVCSLLNDMSLSSVLSNDIMGLSRATIKLLASYYTVITGKVLDGDTFGQFILLKGADMEQAMYDALGTIRNVVEFKRVVYGSPYTKKYTQLSPNALLDALKRMFKPDKMDFLAEYCAYMHIHHMIEYPPNTLQEGWYKADERGNRMHSQIWYSMAMFVAAVYKDYKPLLVWLEKYQYKKEQKGWNMDVMRAKFKASEVLGLGIDVKQHKVGKGVIYNFLKEGMVGPLVNH